jgi:ABC-type amino acid transport substrate-binding protein
MVTGYAPELLKEICRNLGIPFRVDVMDWEAAYSMAKETPGTVLFSTSMNAQRRDLFKWAGPIATLDWQFYAMADKQISLKTLEDAKAYPAIGVLKDYTLEQFLVSQGFTNLVYCEDHTDAILKLLQGTIDLYPCDRFTMEAGLVTQGKSFYTVEEVLPIKTEMIYFAFHLSTPDNVVDDFQEEINRLKDNGIVRQLYQKYLNSSDYPGTLMLYTEDYPPITFMNSYGEISGYGSDIVKEIMKRNRIFGKINLSSWSNGYELALNNPNFCLFTMDRTQIRESLFRWVGPIGTNTTWFYVTKKSDITIKSLDEAKNLASVGTVSSWFSDQHLRQLGFSNLSSGKDPVSMTKKLMTGEINSFVCSGVTFPDILTEAGYRYEEVVPAFSLMSSDYYIAFSKSTDNAIVQQWQTTFDAMVADGTISAIRKRWFPE